MAIITALVCGDSQKLSDYENVIERVAGRVLPSSQAGRVRIHLFPAEGVLTAILGRGDNLRMRDGAILSGLIEDNRAGPAWWRPGAEAPDGSFALVRHNDGVLEALTDYSGSRTLWYARLSRQSAVVSTALEVVVALLGSFEPDPKALGWFLSAGNCGARRSWDRRIKPLPRNTRLRISRAGDEVHVSQHRIWTASPARHHFSADELRQEVRHALAKYDFGDDRWWLALSGGYDSRVLLDSFRSRKKLRCVSWADEQKAEQAGGDVAVARQLADAAGCEHEVRTLRRPDSAGALERSARRFVRYCDGRTDNLLMYIDEMALWEELGTSDTGGVLRGDEVFGSETTFGRGQVLRKMRLMSFRDYSPGARQRELAARYPHALPTGLERRDGESLNRWRWRLRASFEIPTVYSSLSAIRARFVETASPLLSRRIVALAESMNDSDLDDKHLYKEAFRGVFPGIGLASERSILTWSEFFEMSSAIDMLEGHLCSERARHVLGAKLASAAARALQSGAPGSRGERNIAARFASGLPLPKWLRRYRRSFAGPPTLNLRMLAVRSLLAEFAMEELAAAADAGATAQESLRHAIA